IAPVVLLVASSVIFSLVGRMRRRDLFIWYVGLVTVLSIAAQVLLPVTTGDYWFTYVLAQVVKDTVYLIFWVYAGNLFDSEQSKRIFPLFAGSLSGYRLVSRDTLLRPFGVNIFFWYFLMQIANYLFAAGLDTATKAGTLQQSQDEYTLLYASVYTGGSLVALGIQTFLTGGLIRRFGVSVVIFAFPLWYLV